MNNSIIKLIITGVTFLSVSFVNSQAIDKRLPSSNEGVMIGPETPVYHVGYPHSDNSTYQSLLNKFKGSPSYYYYRNSNYTLNDTFFPKVLVVVDWVDGIENKEQEILDKVLTTWNKVDKYFEQLDNPKIKLAIAGVVIPTKSDTWRPNFPTDGIDHVPDMLDNMTKWFNDNTVHFENLNYDFFIFMTSAANVQLKSDPKNYRGSISTPFACDPKHGSQYLSTGGIVSNNKWLIHTTTFDVARMLNVSPDEEKKCGTGHIMDNNNSLLNVTWSECSKQKFKLMIDNSNYACLHQIPYGQYEDDYTFFRKDF